MQWRDHMPSNCPPDDAIPATGKVYRLAEKVNFDEHDFLSFRELKPDKEYDVAECIVCGISVYTELDGIRTLLARVPGKRKMFGKRKIIEGVLIPKFGKMKNTPSNMHKSHHTWWIPKGECPWDVFNVIELPQEDNGRP